MSMNDWYRDTVRKPGILEINNVEVGRSDQKSNFKSNIYSMN